MTGSYLNVMQNKHSALLQPTVKDWTLQAQRDTDQVENCAS